jgi:hypothetical protein
MPLRDFMVVRFIGYCQKLIHQAKRLTVLKICSGLLSLRTRPDVAQYCYFCQKKENETITIHLCALYYFNEMLKTVSQ